MNFKSIILETMKLSISLLFLISLQALAGNLTSSVDRNSLGADETFMLTLSAQGQSNDEPNISELNNDFDVLGKSSSRSINIINGNYQARTDWQIQLAPKRSGKLLIPSFKLGKDVSDAIPIEVSATSTQPTTDSNAPIQLTIEVSKKKAYVQEQVFVKVKLISQVSLSHLEPQAIQIPNARVVAYDTRQYQTSSQGRPQLVVETDYAIFPQEVGELKIPSVVYKIEQDNSRDFFSNPWGRSRNPISKLSTEEQLIKVLPPEQNTSLSEWLPTESLKITETWSGSFDHVKVGDALTRSINIEAEGLTGAQITPLNFEKIDGLTFYPDQARIEDAKLATGIQGKRIESLAIVANRAGKFHLPAIEIRWWNTKNHAFEIARLAEKDFEVETDPNASVKMPNNLSSSSINNINTTQTNSNNSATNANQNESNLKWQIFCALLLVIILGLSLYIIKLRATINKTLKKVASPTHIDTQISNQKTWEELKQAANEKNAANLRKAIIRWAHEQCLQGHWPEDSIGSLDQVAEQINQKDFTIALRALDASLYSDEKNITINSDLILKHLKQYQKRSKDKMTDSKLRSLYPQ